MKNIYILLSVLLYHSVYSQETLLLRHPSISGNKIAFAYASDIWIINKDGSDPQRLTVNPDVEYNPVISQDGRWVAFTGIHDGNPDVYVIVATGGNPTRLTFHPAAEIVRGWSGNNIIYSSTKESPVQRYGRLFMVNALTGEKRVLPMPQASQGNISPDGKLTAYIKNPDTSDGNRNYAPFNLYRGGLMPQVWIFNNNTHDIEEIPGTKNNNNTRPVWAGNDKVYFLSDRDNHTTNFYYYDRTRKEVKKVTNFTDYNVKTLQGNSDEMVFEQGGRIHFLSIKTGISKPLNVVLNADFITKRAHWVDGSKFIRSTDISPTGIRAVVECRGEIITMPADKGDIRNLTNTTGINELSPAWSPDGKYIAYFSDADGEYHLVLSASRSSPNVPGGTYTI